MATPFNVWQGVQQGQQLVDGLFQQQDQMRAGRALASGNYADAMRALGAGGDVQGLRQIQADQVASQARQQAQTKEQQAQQLNTTLQVVRTLKRARSENQDLGALVEQYRPAFAAMGTDPAQFDVIAQQITANPAFLDQIEAVIGEQARNLEVVNFGSGRGASVVDLDTGNEVRRLTPEQQPITVANNSVLYDPGTGEALVDTRSPDYIQRDPTKELIEVTPRAASTGGGQPRGIRNNNPGNIEDGPFAQSLPGYKGSDGRFAIFETPQDGVNAGAQLLGSYARRGVVTPAQVINRWAPPSDNNPTQAYAQYVAQRLGIGVNDPIPESRRGEAFQAIKEFENGTRGPSQGSAPSSGPRVVAAATARTGLTTLNEAEKAELGITGAGTYQRDDQGRVSLVPGTGPEKSEKFTEGQRNAAYFYHRLSGASSELAALESRGITRPSPAILAFGEGRLRENALSAEDRQWLQAARNWLSPILRKDTGAAITAPEVIFYMGEYLPSPTDDPATIAQKARSRQRAEASLRGLAGNAYDELFPDVRTNQPRVRFSLSPQQQSWVAQNGRAETSGGVRRRAGSRENPRLINPANATQSYNNIPSGSYFLTPDGQLRQKR